MRADDAGPDDPVCGPTKLVEDVIGLLEAAGCPTEINDEIVKLVEQWESKQESPSGDESPRRMKMSDELLDTFLDQAEPYFDHRIGQWIWHEAYGDVCGTAAVPMEIFDFLSADKPILIHRCRYPNPSVLVFGDSRSQVVHCEGAE
jgi:hypothetical protein